ncbi:MAG: uroporphyrinogen decarboxylase [Myxococcota bacterium]
MDAITRFLNACRREPVDRPPVWLMRQAGRYQATYQAVRKKVSFMELCRTPELACEVTMMPLDQLGADAAILFSDILVPLEPMGAKVWFEGGPNVAPPVRDAAGVDRLRMDAGVADEVGYVYEAVELIRRELGDSLPLLGFSGSPWTLASYLVEGGSSRHHHELKSLMYGEPEALERLLDGVSTVVSAYLRRQIEAGCDAVQLFDSWGGLLDPARWQRFSGRWLTRILEDIRDTGVPTIVYVNGGAHLLDELSMLPCDVLSVDWRTPLADVRARIGDSQALQGNVDPAILRAPIPVIRESVRECLESYGPDPGHVMNLGHGITPDATVETAKAFVDAAKEFGEAFGGTP